MPMPDSKSDSVHSTKTSLPELSSNPNVKDRCCPCLRKWSFVFDAVSVDQTPCGSSSSGAEAGLYTDTQHVCVLAALALHDKISILSGLVLKQNKTKKFPVIVNESVVSRCLLLSFKSNQNQGGNIEILSQCLSHLCPCQAIKIM